MGQLIVRNIEDSVKEALRKRAKEHGRSVEEEVREILRNATNQEERKPSEGLGTYMARMAAKYGGLPSPIPEMRGFKVKPIKFK